MDGSTTTQEGVAEETQTVPAPVKTTVALDRIKFTRDNNQAIADACSTIMRVIEANPELDDALARAFSIQPLQPKM